MTKEEFIQEFKQMVVEGVSYYMPKEYRTSLSYTELPLEKKFQQALKHGAAKTVLESVIEQYYEQLKEYEETLGY